MAEINGIEIPEEMLESIAGGVLDDVSRQNLKGLVGLFKANGYSLEETYSLLAYLQHSKDWDEINALIAEYYPIV